MKVKIQQQQLNSGISTVKPFSGDNATQPAFNNILLDAKDGYLTLAATNGEYISAIKLECEVTEAGGVTVPASLLSNYVSTLKSDYVELNGSEFDLDIRQGKGKSKIKGIPKEEFITLPEFGQGEIRLNLEYFQDVLSQVLFAVATDQSRPIFCGVNFKIENNVLNLTTADGFRSANYFMECNAHDVNCTIPLKPLQEITKLKPIENFSLTIHENKILFYGDNFLLSSNVIEGNYPDIKRLEPTDFNTVVKVDKASLFKTLKGARIFSEYDANYVLLNFENDVVNVSTRQTEIGTFEDELNCQIEGKNMHGWYNCGYLLSMLAACPNSEVGIKINDERSPMVMKDDKLTLIIMPMTGVK